MGKRKVGFKKAKNTVDNLRSAVGSDDDEGDAIDAHLESILDDEIDQYNSFKEKSLLDKGKKAKGRAGKRRPDESDEEEEVYGLNLTSDEDDDEAGGEKLVHDTSDEEGGGAGGDDDDSEEDDEDDDDEDIYGGGDAEAGIPDSRAWGKKARVYHDTDYVDQDFGGFEGEDAAMAEQEEAEAREIQKRLNAEFDEADFLGLVPTVPTKPSKKGDKDKEILKMDFDSLSASEKRKLIERECPEVIHLLEARKEKLAEAEEVKELMENQSSTFLRDFYVTKYHAIMNYCINISYFLYLRATNPASSKGHPVIKRILQFRRLLDELSTFSPKKYLRSLEASKNEGKIKKPKTKTTVQSRLARIASGAAHEPDQMEIALLGKQNDEEGDELGDEEEGPLEKRGINYTIAKNKGLTPYRKKELRNPRVKHRMKFQKATVRRKGQVRKPRTEVRKYDGELTGIKMNITKSIKFK